MAKIARQGGIAYVGMDDSRQRLFHLGSTILTAEKDSGLLAIIAKLSRKTSRHSNFSDVLHSLEHFVEDYSCAASIDLYGLDKADEFHSASLNLKTRQQKHGYETESLESLAGCNQFGIISRKGAKALYSPDIRLEILPEEYDGLLEATRQGKRRTNTRVFELFKRIVKNPAAKSFLQRLSEEYVAHDYGMISNLDFNRELNSIERRLESMGKAPGPNIITRTISKSKGALAEMMHHSQKKSSGIVIELPDSHHHEQRQELAYKVEKTFSLQGVPLKYAKGIVLVCQYENIAAIMQSLNKELAQFSRSHSYHVRQAYTFFIPEIVQSVKKTGEIVLCPIKMRMAPKAYDQLWNLENIGAYAAQKKAKGQDIKVAVVDTGVDYDHPEISDRYSGGTNIIDNNSNPYDGNGHGTHVSGTICGESTGVAPKASLYAVKVLSDEGYGSEITVCQGIEWCIDNDMQVLNMSLGSPYPSSLGQQICRKAYEQGIMVVAAAGNESFGRSYPASYPGVISVAAVDMNNEHAYFSNICDTLDISAPGVDIYSAWAGGGYNIISGTSMASPHVAGACTLALSAKLSNRDLEESMKASAQDLGDPDTFGAGLVRVDKLINSSSLTRRRAI